MTAKLSSILKDTNYNLSLFSDSDIRPTEEPPYYVEPQKEEPPEYRFRHGGRTSDPYAVRPTRRVWKHRWPDSEG